MVDLDFAASAPNREWLSVCTYVMSWSGFVYVALVIGCFSRPIVGRHVSGSDGDHASRAGSAPWAPGRDVGRPGCVLSALPDALAAIDASLLAVAVYDGAVVCEKR